MSNFWQKLPKPFMVLAPMENVTDFVFREVMTELPQPDIFFTEFTSADGLVSQGYDRLIHKFKYSKHQRPIVAQVWGTNPQNLFKATEIVRKLNFDGVDINMGCPDRTVMKKGAGAALTKNQKLAREIIDAVKSGAGDMPVSVKTRIGYNAIITDEWIPFLLSKNIAALTVHGRTAKELSKVPAHWDEIGRAVGYKNEIAPETVVVGNGDMKSYKDALQMHREYGVDGVMIGRGIFANPWAFDKNKNQAEHSKEEYLEVLRRHLQIYEENVVNSENFAALKKFFKMYINNFYGASELRQTMMEAENLAEVRDLISHE